MKKPIEDMTKEDILEYAADNGEMLNLPNVYLGGWLDEGIGYLDVSTNVKSLQDAIDLALDSDQLAFGTSSKVRVFTWRIST